MKRTEVVCEQCKQMWIDRHTAHSTSYRMWEYCPQCGGTVEVKG